MKTQELDPTQPLELTVQPDYQASPIVITGNYEAVMPLAEALQAEDARIPVQHASKPRKPATEAVRPSDEVLTGRRATVIAKLYDIANGTAMYDMLKQRREDERNLAMAKKLGLITTDRCAKHERQLASIKGMR